MQYTGYRQCIFISSTGGFVFFTNVYFVLRFLFHGFMPKIIFFYAEKLRAIYWCVVFFLFIPNALQNFYRSSKKLKFWLPNTFHFLQETVNNESFTTKPTPYNLDFNGPSSFIYILALVFLSLQNWNDPFISESLNQWQTVAIYHVLKV